MGEQTVLKELHDHVGLITINRPDTLNALNIEILIELESALESFELDSNVRVIIITGSGDRAFVAGGDINDLNSRRGLAHYLEFAETIHRVFRKLETSEKPTIAAVNGWALGGGVELLLCADIRILSDSAKLGLPEINLGLFPGAGGSQRLVRNIPPCRAREMLFTGEPITAEEAIELGLANRVVPKDSLINTAFEMANHIATKSPIVLKLLKRALLYGGDMPLTSALAFEQGIISLVLDSDDAHEGCSAFLEKRKPRFIGK